MSNNDDIAARLATLKREVAALRGKGVRPVVIKPAKPLMPDMLPRARSGAATRAAMDRVNSDRSAVPMNVIGIP